MNGGITEVHVLFLERRECIVANAIEQVLFPCFLGAEIIGVQCLVFLVLHDNLLALCCTHSGCKGRGRICAWVGWSCVDPSRIADYDPILVFGYHACEETVALSFGKMGGL